MTGEATTDVVIVGAGPVGLFLAGAVARAGHQVTVCERGAHLVEESRASTLQARAMEALDDHGVGGLDRLPHVGQGHYAGIPLDLTRVDSPWAGQWKLAQPELTRRLARWACRHGSLLQFGSEVTGVRQGSGSATAVLRNGRSVNGRYLVGCDGTNGTVAAALGVSHDRRAATRVLVRCDVTGALPPRRFERHGTAVLTAGHVGDGVTRVMVHEPAWGSANHVTFDDVARLWWRATGEELPGPPRWLDRFNNGSRLARSWRVGRALLCGDAAHEFLPVGGQSLNSGLLDAHNLAWKLVWSLRSGTDHLLDSYAVERSAAARASREAVQRQEQLIFSPRDEDWRLRRDLAAGIAGSESLHDELAAAAAGTHVAYPDGTPSVGPRLSDAALMRLGIDPQVVRIARRQTLGVLAYSDPTELPLLPLGVEAVPRRPRGAGCADPDGDLLIRPDGHIAWSEQDDTPLRPVLTHWFPSLATPNPLARCT